MTLIRKPQPLKLLPSLSAELSALAVKVCMPALAQSPHDGWADLIVHQSAIAKAIRVAAEHNASKPSIQVRVLTDTKLGRSDWKLQTRSAEIANLWANKTK